MLETMISGMVMQGLVMAVCVQASLLTSNPPDPIPVIRHALEQGLFDEALARLPALHAAGNTEASRILGCMYLNGDGVGPDREIGRDYLLHASTNGNAKAMFQLGRTYRADEPETYAAWMEKAARHGDIIAAQSIGLAYQDGEGVARDPVKAYMWLFSIQLRTPVGAESWMRPLTLLDLVLDPEEVESAQLEAWNFVYIETRSGFYQEKFEADNPGFEGPIRKGHYRIVDGALVVTGEDD